MSADERLDQELAEYLAGEMPEEQRRAFEGRLAADPALAAEARSLAGALVALRSLDEGEREGAGDIVAAVTARAHETRVYGRGRERGRIGPALRMAAAIAIAFGAGLLARGMMSGSARPALPPGPVATRPDARPEAPARAEAPGWETRLARGYLSSTAGSSDLGRSFAALARATRSGGGG